MNSEKILLVDDDLNILNAYKRNMRGDFNIYIANDAKTAMAIIKKDGPFSVVVSDLKMPEIDGIKFLSMVKEKNPDTVRVILTGFANINTAIDAINEGNIFRFLTKPCPVEKLKSTIIDSIKQYQLITAEKDLLDRTLKGSLNMMVDILATVNPLAFNVATRYRQIAKKLLHHLEYKHTWEVEMAALLSQIGLVSVPNEIIEKKVHGQILTEEESKMYNKHSEIGSDLLKNIPRMGRISESLRLQYESNNNSKIEIPFPGRMLKVINDFFELQTIGNNEEETIKIMQENKNEYDIHILGALVAEVRGIKGNTIVVFKNVKELVAGMTLAEGLTDINGRLLLPKGSIISAASLSKIFSYNKITHLKEPIKVIEEVESNLYSTKV